MKKQTTIREENVRFYATGMLQRESERDRWLPHVVTPAPHRRVAAHSVRALRGVPSVFWARKLEFAAVITENDSTSEPPRAVVAGPNLARRLGVEVGCFKCRGGMDNPIGGRL